MSSPDGELAYPARRPQPRRGRRGLLRRLPGDRCQSRDETGAVIGDHSPATRRAAAQVVIDVLNYRELFTADRLPGGLRPWGGASASAVAEMRSGRDENRTPPVPGPALQPLLAAALYAVTTLGSHAVKLAAELRETATMRSRTAHRPGERAAQKNPLTHLPPVRRDHDAARADQLPGPQAAGERLGSR